MRRAKERDIIQKLRMRLSAATGIPADGDRISVLAATLEYVKVLEDQQKQAVSQRPALELLSGMASATATTIAAEVGTPASTDAKSGKRRKRAHP
jgi:hypothetical protein